MKKITLIPIFLISCLIVLTTNIYAETAKDAYAALKKVEAYFQTGISIKDYSNLLGETKFTVNMYLEGDDSKINPELTFLICKVMKHYENIGNIRKEILNGPYKYLDPSRSTVPAPETYIMNMLVEYPESNKFVEAGGAIDRATSDKGKDLTQLEYGPILNLNYLLPIIEKTCSEDLKELSVMYNKRPNKNLKKNP